MSAATEDQALRLTEAARKVFADFSEARLVRGPRPQIWAVYVLRHIDSGKIYIGCSGMLIQRMKQHLQVAAAGKDHPLYAAIRSFGAQAFELDVLEVHENSMSAFKAEAAHIMSRGSYISGRGFNHPLPGLNIGYVVGISNRLSRETVQLIGCELSFGS